VLQINRVVEIGNHHGEQDAVDGAAAVSHVHEVEPLHLFERGNATRFGEIETTKPVRALRNPLEVAGAEGMNAVAVAVLPDCGDRVGSSAAGCAHAHLRLPRHSVQGESVTTGSRSRSGPATARSGFPPQNTQK